MVHIEKGKVMKKIIINVITIFYMVFLLGCQSEEVTLLADQNSTKIKKVEKVLEQEGDNGNDLLREMGLIFEKEKIIIDLNRTDNFFLDLEKRADEKAKSIEKELEEINISRDAGILIEETKLSIDLNKTKNLLDNLSHLFETILFDANSTNR